MNKSPLLMQKVFLTCFVIIFFQQTLLQAAPVGRAILVKGRAEARKNNQIVVLKAGTPIEEGSTLVTGDNSSLKVMLKDETLINLGPLSASLIDRAAGENTTGSLAVVKGQVRTHVTKNLFSKLQNSNTPNKIKYLIRSRSATMGVRGTDFEVIYNPQNSVTSVVTFEGGVSMVRNEKEGVLPAKNLEGITQVLGSEKSVLVTEGTFSSANTQMPMPTIPTKLSPAQFESLKNPTTQNTSQVAKAANPSTSSVPTPPQFIPPLPPGADPKAFFSNGVGLEKQFAGTLSTPPSSSTGLTGPTAPSTPPTEIAWNAPPANTPPPAEGFYDQKKGYFAPPAGGFLDLKTGLYLPPPPGSTFDHNTGVYVPPVSIGQIDTTTGSYVPPAGLQMDPTKGLVAAHMPPTTQMPGSPTMAPGSIAGSPTAGSGAQKPPIPGMALAPGTAGSPSGVIPNAPIGYGGIMAGNPMPMPGQAGPAGMMGPPMGYMNPGNTYAAAAGYAGSNTTLGTLGMTPGTYYPTMPAGPYPAGSPPGTYQGGTPIAGAYNPIPIQPQPFDPSSTTWTTGGTNTGSTGTINTGNTNPPPPPPTTNVNFTFTIN